MGGGSGRDPVIGRAALDLARSVRSGQLSPVDVVRAHLDRIAALDGSVGAFQLMRRDRALAEAQVLANRPDLASLPLAGVPIGVKDNRDVAGEPTRMGSAATSTAPAAADAEIVDRIRAAGAVIVGKTTIPELGLWATTDTIWRVTRNPWRLDRTAGGSSGGSAAAVAAAMVPLAHGNDGLGSVRIPAAACGLVGFKPSSGLAATDAADPAWFGMTEPGPFATTVEDAALLLSVLAGRPELARVGTLDRPLRVAVSVRPPIPGVLVDGEWRAAAERTGTLLSEAGHRVDSADPPYPLRYGLAVVARWCAAAARSSERLEPRRLERRTRGHARAGRLALRAGLIREEDRECWRRIHGEFFRRFDVLVTPALARPPLRATRWSRRSWAANILANTRFAPFAAPWNFVGFPAAVVPAGLHPHGTPLSVQLVAGPGRDALLLAVADQIERLRPWTRHAPLQGP